MHKHIFSILIYKIQKITNFTFKCYRSIFFVIFKRRFLIFTGFKRRFKYVILRARYQKILFYYIIYNKINLNSGSLKNYAYEPSVKIRYFNLKNQKLTFIMRSIKLVKFCKIINI